MEPHFTATAGCHLGLYAITDPRTLTVLSEPVLQHYTADTERATFTVKGRFANAASCTRRQQSRLLQHSAGWDLRITPWSTPVSAECCCSVGILGKEVRTRDSTSLWPSLVESPGENKVPSLCSDAPLSTWHRAAVSCRDPATDIRHVYTSPSPVCCYANSRHPDDSPVNTRRSSVFCGGGTRVEHSSVYAEKCSVTYNVPAPPQNRTV